jgi:hypothetical protein
MVARATDDLLVSASRANYEVLLKAMSKKWTMHDKGLAKFFFGIRITQSIDGISLDQIPYAKEIVATILGPEWETKHPNGKGHSSPMPAGTDFEKKLVECVPLDSDETKKIELRFGFKYRSLLCGIMHLSLWTRPDISPACIRLARYQSAPGSAHFVALNWLLFYIREHLHNGLMYQRDPKTLPDFHKNLCGKLPGPTPVISAISVMISGSHASVIDDVMPSNLDVLDPPAHSNDFDMPMVNSIGGIKRTVSANKSTSPIFICDPPLTDGMVDASFGTIFEVVGFTGALISMIGTAIWWLCRKQATIAYNTAESELYAATDIGKFLKWLRLLMADLGLPYKNAISVGEDNDACRLIGHGHKIGRNIRHVVIQSAALQRIVSELILTLR